MAIKTNITSKSVKYNVTSCIVLLFCLLLQLLKPLAIAMLLKYQAEIDGLALKSLCPVETVPTLGVEVYRWSYDPIEHERNFLPNVVFDRVINYPYPYHKRDDSTKCKRCAASFFTSIPSAKARWESLTEQNKENLGYTHIASGTIDDNDGIINKPDKSGHFGFYEYATANLVDKFKVITPLNDVGS